jgi:hypothetical protein
VYRSSDSAEPDACQTAKLFIELKGDVWVQLCCPEQSVSSLEDIRAPIERILLSFEEPNKQSGRLSWLFGQSF